MAIRSAHVLRVVLGLTLLGVLLPGFFGIADWWLVANRVRPAFSVLVGTYPDGGSRRYRGLGYDVLLKANATTHVSRLGMAVHSGTASELEFWLVPHTFRLLSAKNDSEARAMLQAIDKESSRQPSAVEKQGIAPQ